MQRCASVLKLSQHLPALAASRCPSKVRNRPLYIMASALRNETREQRAARKEEVKKEKAEKRARREGYIPEGYGQKDCDLCQQKKDLLIRCQIDETETWHMVCGKCWNTVSGGVVDGDDDHPYYRYGGLWKNLHKADQKPGASKTDSEASAGEFAELQQLVTADLSKEAETREQTKRESME